MPLLQSLGWEHSFHVNVISSLDTLKRFTLSLSRWCCHNALHLRCLPLSIYPHLFTVVVRASLWK